MGLCSLATQAANNAVLGNKDGFANTSERNKYEMLGQLTFIVVHIALVLLIGKWLWDNVATKLFTICKPMPNVWYLVGLVVLLDLIYPQRLGGCGCGGKCNCNH